MNVNRRRFLKVIGLGVCALTGSCRGAAKKKSSESRPNIVFILADDMGWSDPGCYGGDVATPNLDSLAENGIRFTQMHNTSKCFPSRACLVTGLYAQNCNMARSAGSHIKNAVTFGEVLRSAEYRTLMAGKFHGLDNPYNRGFDRYFGLRDGCCNYFNPGKQRPGEGLPAQKRRERRVWCIDEKVHQPYTPKEKDFYTTDAFTDQAIEYLETYKNEDKPFFLYLAYTAPHDPLQAWPEDIARYEDKYLCGYEAVRKKRYEKQRRMGLIDETFPLSDPEYPDWDSLSEEEQKEEARKMAVYCAMIDRLDQNIGRVLAKIRELGEADNTVVMFASDNGCSAEVVRIGGSGEIGSMTRWTSLGRNWANVSDTPFRKYKNYSYEGGICTPFIVKWPKGIKQKGRVSNQPAHFIDVMPTLMELAGASYPETFNGGKITPFEGRSLLPVIKGEEKEMPRGPLFWQWSRGKAVRKDRWKLVAWNNEWSLFDMENDRTETRDLAGTHPEIVEALKKLYEEWEATWRG